MNDVVFIFNVTAAHLVQPEHLDYDQARADVVSRLELRYRSSLQVQINSFLFICQIDVPPAVDLRWQVVTVLQSPAEHVLRNFYFYLLDILVAHRDRDASLPHWDGLPDGVAVREGLIAAEA